ncbi:hypothetical protein Tco_0312908 [Tanacetum coccineum]
MSTLVENVLAAKAKNQPPMLEKGGYDTWQSHMLLYIEGKEHGEMLLYLIFLGPFQFKMITIPTNVETEKEAETRMQTLADLTHKENIKKEYDIKAANIILHCLSNDIYTLLNHKTKAYDIFMADGLEGFNSDYEDLQLNTTSIFMTDYVDAFDSDYDKARTASVIFMARLSPIGSIDGDDAGPSYDTNILFEVPNYDNYDDNDMFHQSVQELDYSEQPVSVNDTYVALTNDNNVISDIPYAGSIKNEVIQDMNFLAQNDAVFFFNN